MLQQFGLIQRPWGVYYLKNKITGAQTSLKTRDKDEAQRLLAAHNDTEAQPHFNLALARVYMNGADPKLATRTWQEVMEHIVSKKTDETRRRWEVAILDKNFDCIRNLSVAETRPEHFDRALADGKVSSNVYLRRIHNHEIVSLDSPQDAWVKECPLRVHALGPARGKFRYSPKLVPWLKRHASEYDAIIVNGIWQYNSLGVFRGLRQRPTPYYVFPHGMLDPWFKRAYPLKHLKKWLYWPWGEYQVLRNAKAVCFTCEEERRLARESFWLYRCNEKVVAYGTAAPAGDPQRQRQLFFELCPETRGKRIILFLGRIHPKKGCDMLIRAFAQLLEAEPRNPAGTACLHLVVAGPDQTGWSRELRSLAASLRHSKRITWTGILTGDLKVGALRAADVFVLPSHQENFGIAVAEALACSLPVLISNKVNIWREVEQEKAGMIENDDAEGTAQLLKNWYSLGWEEQTSYRDNAYRCFKAHFEINRAAQALISLLAEGSPTQARPHN